MPKVHEGECDGSYADEGCYLCGLRTKFIGTPRDFSSRTRTDKPPRKPDNSYRSAIPTDHRGMPMLAGPDLHPMTQGEINDKRHLVEETRKRNRQAPAPPT